MSRGLVLPPIEAGLAAVLRREVGAMADAYAEALLEMAPGGSVVGIYAKGSAFKPWDSAIDYVPEFSDVDIHVRFVDTASARNTCGTVESALTLAERAKSLYEGRIPDPAHRPRPQLVVLNDLEAQVGYVPSPHETVKRLYGQDYAPATASSHPDTRKNDARRLEADAEFIEVEAPMKLVDRPGCLAWQVVSLLTWRVAPAGPRVLTQLGVGARTAWSVNRSSIIGELVRRGEVDLAESYAAFYRAGWGGFRSAFRDGGPARDAVLAAARLFRGARAVLAGRTAEGEE